MSRIIFLFVVGFLTSLVHANQTVRLYGEASKLVKQGKHEQAHALFDKSLKQAQEENLTNYVWYAGYNGSYAAYRSQQYEASIRHAKLAIKVLGEHQKDAWARKDSLQINKIELLGLIERNSSVLYKVGQGWDYNQRAMALLQKETGMPVDVTGLNPERVADLPLNSRVLGWRLIGRQSYYLHMMGRSDEARSMLRKAITCAENDLGSPKEKRWFYSSKLLNQLSVIESFIGYKSEAIALNEKEIAFVSRSGARRRVSCMIAKMNLLDAKANLFGVDDALLESARKIVEEARNRKINALAGMERMLISMERSQMNTAERVKRLEELSHENEAAGDLVESFYSSRNALFSQSDLGGGGLDAKFHAFLEATRLRGDKKSEPRIYRRYGDWLKIRKRYGEAISVYREALRMTIQFGWHPGVPLIQSKLGATYLADGQVAAADQMWQQMDRYIQTHPDIPNYATLRAWSVKLLALLQSGRGDEALQLAERARGIGKRGEMASKWLAPFQENVLRHYLDDIKGKAVSRTTVSSESAVTLQPLEMTTVALKGCSATSSFYLINRQAVEVFGVLIVSGPGLKLAQDSQQGAPSFTGVSDQNEAVLEVAMSVPAGSLVELPFIFKNSSSEREQQNVSLRWQPKKGAGIHASWQLSWGDKTSEAVVLNAARLGLSPFVGVPVLHSVGFADSQSPSQGFRLRSPEPLRIEYRDPRSGTLLAVDDNGNGDFGDAGDFFPTVAGQESQVNAPKIRPLEGMRVGSVEVWIYLRDGNDIQENLSISVELHRGTQGWEEYARNVIQFSENP